VTVKLYVKTLGRKLGAKNRTQAAMIARDHMLL
jgi:DNA-binding NarL/FixJ family response regulator